MTFTVGSWLVRPDMNMVQSDGEERHLSPKSMDVLTCLARRQGQVVSKDEIAGVVWKDTIVSDDSLTRCIAELRRALGDDAREPAIIKTIPKRGYLLLPPVTWDEGGAPTGVRAPDPPVEHDSAESGAVADRPTPITGRPAFWRRGGITTGIGILVLGAVLAALSFLAWQKRSTAGAQRAFHRVAVLPLSNLSGDSGQEYFAEGMTDQLITELAQYQSWEVISRTSVMRYKGTRKSAREIARDLGVDGLMEGTILRSGNRVRITVQMIDATTDSHLWSGSFEQEAGDAIALQANVARAIAGKLNLTLGPRGQARSRMARKVSPEAYESYLHGWYFFDRAKYDPAAAYFEQATIADPEFALAQALLAESDFMLAYNNDRLPSERCLRAIEKARRLDDNLAEVRCLLGDRLFMNYDWLAGAAEYRRAVELDPGSVDAAAHYVVCLHVLTRWHEAEQEVRRALRLDPVSPRLNFELLRLLVDAGRHDQALEQFHRMVEMDPHNPLPYQFIVPVYLEQGREDKALESELKATARYSGLDELPKEVTDAARKDGLRGYARKSLEQLRQTHHPLADSPVYVAGVYSRLGEKDKALRLLEIAYREHRPQMIWLKAGAGRSPLRFEPRFQSLLSRMHYPD